ncbi:hypothetical protein Acsp04_60130 [Actinomadura sp. NBRC 104425]|nr:hypothetical protein Acsp04_60130 [Actinomadura sp. NBRC 104425]
MRRLPLSPPGDGPRAVDVHAIIGRRTNTLIGGGLKSDGRHSHCAGLSWSGRPHVARPGARRARPRLLPPAHRPAGGSAHAHQRPFRPSVRRPPARTEQAVRGRRRDRLCGHAGPAGKGG